MAITQLRATQVAAHAAWKAAPSKETEEALRVASAAYHAARREVDAAKEAAEKASADPARQERIAARQAGIEAVKDVQKHGRVIARAFEWPRCGEEFPATKAEAKAMAWAAGYGSLQAAMAALEVFS